MLFSIQQQFILDIVKRLGCLRKAQLLILTREKFRRPDLEIGADRLEYMLRQLRSGTGDIRLEGDLVLLPNIIPEPLRIEAVDVMLELSKGVPTDLRRGESPVLLQFSTQENERLRLFAVAELRPGVPPSSIVRHKMERIIWLSEDEISHQDLPLPHKHFFAARQADGTHRFYGSNEP